MFNIYLHSYFQMFFHQYRQFDKFPFENSFILLNSITLSSHR